jgi:hypothetical protein
MFRKFGKGSLSKEDLKQLTEVDMPDPERVALAQELERKQAAIKKRRQRA